MFQHEIREVVVLETNRSRVKTDVTIDSEVYYTLSRRIAWHIVITGKNSILMEDLMNKISEDETLNSTLRTPWFFLQVKNEMIKNGLLYVSFDKPLRQLVGLSLKGQAVFEGNMT